MVLSSESGGGVMFLVLTINSTDVLHHGQSQSSQAVQYCRYVT